MKPGSKAYGILLIGLYGLVRAPWILSPFTGLMGYNPRGVIAHEILAGLKLPLWDYTVDPYGLGSLLMACLTVPFFKLFGETAFAFKLVPFFWHLLSVLLWYLVWLSFYPPRKAFFISLFPVLALPLVTQYSLTSFGYHSEMILWTALVLLLLKKSLEGTLPEKPAGFLLGLVGGLSSALVISNLVTVAAVLLSIAWSAPRNLRRKIFYGMYLAGFFLGLSPWILFNIRFAWSGFSFFSGIFFQGGYPASFFVTLYRILRWTIPSLFIFSHQPGLLGPWLAKTLAVLYYLSLLTLGLRQWKKRFGRGEGRLDLETFSLLYQVLFLTLMACAKTYLHDHYLFPLVPFIGFTLFSELSRLGQKAQGWVIAGWVVLSLSGNFGLINWSEMGQAFSTPATSEREVGFSLALALEPKYGNDPELFREKSERALQGKSPEAKAYFYTVLKDEN